MGDSIVNWHGMTNMKYSESICKAVENTGALGELIFFFFFFSLLWPSALSKEDAKHTKTIGESHSDIPSSLGTGYSATVKIFTSVGSRGWNDWHRGMYFLTAGLPFWSLTHFSQVTFPVAAGLNSTCVCLNLSYFDTKHRSCDWPAGAIGWLLPETADKWFQPRKI